jgi:integrase
MNVSELKTDIIIIEWFKHVRARPHTQESYLQCMQEYTNFLGMSPIELIEEAEAEIEARVKPRKQKIKTHLTGFREYLVNKGLAPMSVENRITGVRSFYKANDIIIPELQRRESTARILEVHKGVPTKESIQKVVSISDPLEKAIILVGLSSGLAVNEICELRVSDFKNGYDPETGITTLSLRREKKQVDFITFLTPEASKAVHDYLIYRERKPKNGKEECSIPLKKQKIVSDSGYLFIKRSVPDDYLKIKTDGKREGIDELSTNTVLMICEQQNEKELSKLNKETILEMYSKFDEEELRKLQDFTVQEMYRELCVSTGMCTDRGVWNLFRSHNMRKYFNNRLIAAKCDPMLKEFMMGHKISNKTQASYFVADPTELKELYKSLVPYLIIESVFDYSGSPEYLEMKSEIDQLKSEKANLFEDMKEELDKLKQMESSRENAVSEFMEAFKDPAKRKQIIEDRQGVTLSEADELKITTDDKYASISATLAIPGIMIDTDEKAAQERRETTSRLCKTLDQLMSD